MSMFYVKNIPTWERVLRSLAGVALIVFGVVQFGMTTSGFVVIGIGIMAAVTGFVGFCPACALVGRRLKS
jgi:hypothetical protein